MINPRGLFQTAGLAIVLLMTGAKAQAVGFGEETVSIKLGTFLSDFDTTATLSGPNGGTSVNLEDALGLDDQQATFRGELGWRFAPRHRVVLGYYDFERSSVGMSSSSFTVDTPEGTYVFDANATITTEFDWRLIPISYAYSFYKTDDLELSASVGVHWFDATIGFTGSATVTPPGGVPTPVASAAEAETASGPLPVFGLQAGYAITPKWVVGGHLSYFGLEYDEYSGSLVDARLDTEYWFTDNFSVGLGYTWYNIDFAKEKGPYKVGIDYLYNGLEAFVGFRF